MSGRASQSVALGLCAAALAALLTILFASEEMIARLRWSWDLQSVIVKTPSGRLPLNELLARVDALPGLDSSGPRFAAWRDETRGTMERFREAGRDVPFDWYRGYRAELETRTPITLLAVSSVFPYSVAPYWMDVEPAARKRWLADPAAILVRDDVLREQAWHLGDVVHATESGAALELHIAGVYRGRMPRLVVTHFDHMNERRRDVAQDTAQMLALPCLPGRCEELASAVRATSGPARLAFTAEPSGRGPTVDNSRIGTRVLRLFTPPACFVLLVALALCGEPRRRLASLVAGAVVGTGVVLTYAHGASGLPLGTWAYAWAPVSVLAAAAAATATIALGALARRRAPQLLLALAYAVATSTGTLALASRTALTSQLQATPAHTLAVVHVPAGPGASELVNVLSGSTDVEHDGATVLVTREPFSEVMRFDGLAVEPFTVRGIDAIAERLHAPVELEGASPDSLAAPSVWMSDAMLQRFGRHVGDDLVILGTRARIAGRLNAPGLAYESEVWCSKTVLDTVLGADAGSDVVLAVRPECVAVLREFVATLPGHIELDLDADENTETAHRLDRELCMPWGVIGLVALFGAILIASAAARSRDVVVTSAAGTIAGVLVVLACGRCSIYCANLLVHPRLTWHDVLLVIGAGGLAVLASRVLRRCSVLA